MSRHARRRNRQDQELDRDAGADHRPGRAAARREHRRGGARHGQFRAGAAAPGQAARRLAQCPGAALGLRRRPHSRRRDALRDAGGGDRRLHPRAGDHGARPRSGQAGDRAGRGAPPSWRRTSPPARTWRCCSGASATASRTRRSRSPTASSPFRSIRPLPRSISPRRSRSSPTSGSSSRPAARCRSPCRTSRSRPASSRCRPSSPTSNASSTASSTFVRSTSARPCWSICATFSRACSRPGRTSRPCTASSWR